MIDLLLHNLRTIGTHHCDGTVSEEAADEIERLRAEVAGLREDAERYHEWKRAFREGECALWNALCECQSDAEHDAAIDAALAARKGEATTPPPSPSPRS